MPSDSPNPGNWGATTSKVDARSDSASSPTPSPPGYTSVRSLENIWKGAATFALSLENWDQVVEGQYAIVGSPDTVYRLLEEDLERLGTGNLLGLFQLGTLPADLTRRNLELFATEVMPRLRERFPEGQPVLAGQTAVA